MVGKQAMLDEWSERIGPDEYVESLLEMMSMLAEKMRMASESFSAVDAARAVLEDVLGLPTCVVDSDGLALSGAAPDSWYGQSDWGLTTSVRITERDGWVLLPIATDQGLHLCVNARGLQLDTAKTVALREIAALTAFELHIEQAIRNERARLRGDLASELLKGVDRQRVIAHAMELGYDLARPHRVGLVADGRIGLSVDQVQCALRRANVDALVTAWDDCIAVLFHQDDDFHLILRSIDEVVPGGDQWMGLSSVKPEGHDLSEAIAEANIALSFGRTAQESRTIDFEDLGVFRLFALDEKWSILEEFAVETLRPLVEYDRSHGTDLVHTLDAYLRRNGSLGDLADSLMIHRSTLVYRLRRIRELLDVDIDDSRLHLDLSLAARSIEVLHSVSQEHLRPKLDLLGS